MLSWAELELTKLFEGWLVSLVLSFGVGSAPPSPSSDTVSLHFKDGSTAPESLLAEPQGLVIAMEWFSSFLMKGGRLGIVGGSNMPTEVVMVERTGLLSSQLVTGFSGGIDIPYGMPLLVGILSKCSGTG